MDKTIYVVALNKENLGTCTLYQHGDLLWKFNLLQDRLDFKKRDPNMQKSPPQDRSLIVEKSQKSVQFLLELKSNNAVCVMARRAQGKYTSE